VCKNKAKAKGKGPVKQKMKNQMEAKAEGSGDKDIMKSVTMSLTREKTPRLEIHGRTPDVQKKFIVTLTKGDLKSIGRAVAKEVQVVCVFVFVSFLSGTRVKLFVSGKCDMNFANLFALCLQKLQDLRSRFCH
jgi:hypothetical protein